MHSADLYAWLIEATLATSAATLAVLAMRKPLRETFGAGPCHAAWSAVPIALLATLLPAAEADASDEIGRVGGVPGHAHGSPVELVEVGQRLRLEPARAVLVGLLGGGAQDGLARILGVRGHRARAYRRGRESAARVRWAARALEEQGGHDGYNGRPPPLIPRGPHEKGCRGGPTPSRTVP